MHDRPAMLQTMLDHVAQAIAMFDAEHRLVAWNDQLRALLDLPDDLLAGAPRYADFVAHLAERGDFGVASAGIDAAVRELTSGLDAPRTDERMLPDGRILECRRNPLAEGGLILIYTDVSEQRHADYLVQDSERRLRTILEKAPVALAVIGQEDGEVKQVNARFRKLFGLADKKLPDDPDIALYVSGDDRTRILGAQSGPHTDFEAAVRRTDGTEFWALVSSIRFVFEWAPAILTSFHDISDRKQAEARLRDELSQGGWRRPRRFFPRRRQPAGPGARRRLPQGRRRGAVHGAHPLAHPQHLVRSGWSRNDAPGVQPGSEIFRLLPN
jgi:PAS domain S-box-containing protein